MCTDIVSAMHLFYCISKFITAIVIKLQFGGICDNASNEAFFQILAITFHKQGNQFVSPIVSMCQICIHLAV